VTDRPEDASLRRIRDFVRAEVERTSLRKVAEAAGTKLGATKKFVDGSVPYERNLRKWKRYFARAMAEGRAGRPDDSLAGEDAALVLELLLWGFPDEERAAARARAVEAFRALYESAGRTPPAWVQDLLGVEG
jgi:hypothetical protein